MKKILQKLNSIRLCMEAHPDNEPDSEFADRIEDLKELPKMIEEYTKEKTKNLDLQIDTILSGSSHNLQHEYADKWISVKDQLPENSGLYVVHFRIGTILICYHHVGRGNTWYLSGVRKTGDTNPVTHWMPLPKPPKED